MYTVSQSRDISNNNMGAIDPQIVARNQVKIKSASIESNNQPISRSDRNQYEFDQISLMEPEYDYNKSRNNSFHVKAKKFLTLTPGGGLKPSASTSCLFAAEDNSPSNNSNNNNSNNDDNCNNNNNNSNNSNNTANSPAVIPTRASLTHEWKKLKTPNKCRECNLLVYFNGRECSFCNFIAHKKCVPVIVIKCSGQQVVHTSGFFLGFKSSRKSCQPELLMTNSLQLSGLTAQQLQQLQLQQQQQQLLLQQQQQVVTRKVKQTPIQPIFGQPVNVDGRQVVDFVRRFVYEIDTRGLTSKGIYRVSSIKSKVDRLCNYYDQNLSSLVDLSSFHPNIIANALKMYLRQLPEPLLTHRLYNHFIDIGKKYSSNSSAQQTSPKLDGWPTLTPIKQRKSYSFSLSSTPLTASITTTSTRPNIVTNNPAYDPLLIVEFKEIIELLPPINRELIAIIMRHLRRVADMSCENQMSAKNLSIIFGPTLLNASNKSLAIVDNIHQARAIELMITWADQIFPQYANYESKAVIDLYLPETQDEQGISPDTIDRYQLYDTQTVGDKQQKDKFYNNENSHRHQRLWRNGRRSTQNDIETNTNEPLSTKTRNDLRELRRQFFTAPTTTTQQQQTEPTSQPYSTTSANKSPGICPNHSLEPRRAKLINPPGSFPVVKVQPCYCKTLTTNNNTMNKP